MAKKSGPKPRKQDQPVAQPAEAPGQTNAAAKEPAQQFVEWASRNRKRIVAMTVPVVAVILGGLSVWAYRTSKEDAARRELEQVRFAVQSENYALAASDLSRIVATMGGTRSADEASVLLGRVRLQQNEPTVAAAELREALDRGIDPEFRTPAYGLLGAALESIGNNSGAGEAYLQAAGASWYDFVAAQFLNDAGRAFWAAGDTVRAVSAYERVLSDYAEAPSAVEARVRLGELRPSRQPQREG